MSQAAGSRAPIPVTQSLKSELLTLAMYSWFGAILAVTIYAAVQPSFGTRISAPISVPTVATTVTDIERHCIIATAMAEATPNARGETIEIMRNILRRREMGKWGKTACSVVTAPRQYSAWNDRMLPGVPVKPNELYQIFDRWLDEALKLGPSRWTHYIHPGTMLVLYGKKYPKWWSSCVETEVIWTAEFCRMDDIPKGAR
jgi:hypothetical protein